MYEWEHAVSQNTIELNKTRLRVEIRRITSTTLRGNFAKPEDREYWVYRVRQLNQKLAALESLAA